MMNREKQKKEQKTFEYIENPEQIEGFDKIPVPEDLDQRVRAGIEEGKKRRKKTAFRKRQKSEWEWQLRWHWHRCYVFPIHLLQQKCH